MVEQRKLDQMLREAFFLFDRDLDGKVAIQDIPTVIRSLGVRMEEDEIGEKLDFMVEQKQLENKMDITKISVDLFVKLVGDKYDPKKSQEYMIELFKKVDRGGNGTIQTSELKQLLLNDIDANKLMTVGDVNELIDGADRNKKGEIEYKTFVAKLLGLEQK